MLLYDLYFILYTGGLPIHVDGAICILRVQVGGGPDRPFLAWEGDARSRRRKRERERRRGAQSAMHVFVEGDRFGRVHIARDVRYDESSGLEVGL